MSLPQLVVGDWWKIKTKSDNGGIPLIRLESFDSEKDEVIVSDWIDFHQKFVDTPISCGYTRPNPRRFSGIENAKRMLSKHWRRVKPPSKGHT